MSLLCTAIQVEIIHLNRCVFLLRAIVRRYIEYPYDDISDEYASSI